MNNLDTKAPSIYTDLLTVRLHFTHGTRERTLTQGNYDCSSDSSNRHK